MIEEFPSKKENIDIKRIEGIVEKFRSRETSMVKRFLHRKD